VSGSGTSLGTTSATGSLVAWCARHNRVVILAAAVLAVGGEIARRALHRDAIPELADPRIAVVAEWMGHPAPIVARDVTQVLTGAFNDIEGMTAVRGSSMAGMSYVDVVFASTTDLERGRKAIAERVHKVRGRLPGGVRVQVGPDAASTGWVLQYALVDRARRESPVQLRRVQDGVFRPALAALPGVAEVATVGGDIRHALVAVRTDQLRARGLAFTDVLAALRPVAHGRADLRPISEVPVTTAPGKDGASPPRIGDVAHLKFTQDMPTGLADLDGEAPAVGGIVVAHRNADVVRVVEAVKRTLEDLRPKLKNGVELVTVYDRTELVTAAGHTLLRALGEEIVVVVAVILLFLMHARSALVPLATLPLVLLLTFAGMYLLGVSATIMSLGGIAIALGLAVDAEVVALEACHRRLERGRDGPGPADRRSAIIAAAGSFAPAILTSLVITALSFLPVLAFSGETGRLLRPMAIAKTLVVVSTALVAITVAPALRDRLLVGRVAPELANPITRHLVRIYRPFVAFALARPALTLITAVLAVVSCVPIVHRLGGDFLPRVDEGDLLYMPTTLPGAPAAEAGVELRQQDRAIADFPEVASVFGKVGRADTATDPAPYSMAETTIRLLPRDRWPPQPRPRWYSSFAPEPLARGLRLLWPDEAPATTADLIERLDHAVRRPGWTNAWTAPARARMDMMSTGVRTAVGIRIVAADTARLDAIGGALRAVVAEVPGTRSAVFESLGGQPWPRFQIDAAAAARHGVNTDLASSTAELLLAGGEVGELNWEALPFRVRIAVDGAHGHGAASALRDATVRASDGQVVPLAVLGQIAHASLPAVVRSERGEPVAYIFVDLKDGVDVESYVRRAREHVERATAAARVRLAPGERIEWTGQYELLAAGQRRLQWIAPLVVLSMLGLLWLLFRTLTQALIVLASVPFALVGSIWTLYACGYPLSAPAWSWWSTSTTPS
jgi:Cu(I)/Ag(I) efflux system membrane protein CusA/SilA